MNVFIVILYLLSMTLIMAFSLVQFDLARRYSRFRKKSGRSTIRPPVSSDYPFVTIQLPVYNEKYVIARLLESVFDLDYPPDRFEIQVLDDSTDETTTIIRNFLKNNRNQEIRVFHLHRDERTGYKSGALQEGLESANGEFIAIFDADFIPEKDFLKKTIPCFRDQEILRNGVVHGRCHLAGRGRARS